MTIAKKLFTFWAFLLPLICNAQEERIDTIYFDAGWNVISSKIFADFYRVALYPARESDSKLFRDFYMDGTLYAKGSFISLGKENDKESIFDKSIERFYKSGKPLSKCNYSSGELDGEFIEYEENGLVKSLRSYKEGKLDGTVTEFEPDGSYTQIQYRDGEPLYPYYEYGTSSGCIMKLKLSDGSIFWESPNTSEKKSVYKDGRLWEVYTKNGITIGQSLSVSEDYGSWYRIELLITNESTAPIIFEPSEDMVSYSLDRNLKPSILNVISSDQYIAKVSRNQSWNAFFVGLSEAVSSANAGYSSSSTTSNVSFNGYANAYGSASASGAGGYGHASFSGSSSFSGYGQSTSSTRSYDGAAAYQAHVIAQDRVNDFNEAQWAARKALERGYLKKNTINVGETISGYVLIDKGNGSSLIYSIFIGDAEYRNSWIINEDLKHKYDDNVNYLDIHANSQMDEIEQLIAQKKKTKAGIKLNDLLAWFQSRYTLSDDTRERIKSLLDCCEPLDRQKFKDSIYGD